MARAGSKVCYANSGLGAVAQSGSAPRSHRGGQGFKSPQLHPDFRRSAVIAADLSYASHPHGVRFWERVGSGSWPGAAGKRLGERLASARWSAGGAGRGRGATPPSAYLIDLAAAYSMRRQIGDALKCLLEAEALTPEQTRTHRVARDVARDLLQLPGVRVRPELRELAERFGLL